MSGAGRPVPTGAPAGPDRPAPTPPGLGASILRTGLALALAFGVLAGGAGYWQVVEAQRLSSAPDNPSVIALARRVLRGEIVDREGRWLARSSRDRNGEAVREYRDPAVSHVVGYASRRFGTTGLERTYNGELLGLGSAGAFGGLLGKFGTPPDDQLGLRLALDLRLQRAAVAGLGGNRGAVVMLDPATGEVLVLASTPTFDASAVVDPAGGPEAFARLREDPSRPLLPRATLGRYVPGSVFKIVTAAAALNSGAVEPRTTFPEQPSAEDGGLLVDGFRIRDGHHPETGDRPLDLSGATEASCNIWYALAGLETGGLRLVAEAEKFGFGSAIPFDLQTAVSQVTSGDGGAPGGFEGDAELASAAFGQGETFVTPLQMALVAAAVANDGVLMAPRLVTALTGDRPGAGDLDARVWNRVLAPEDARAIQQAMQAAVEGRIGRGFTTGARVPGVSTAGKSGTAELGGRGEPHSWFIGFAPVDEPKVAIAVLVERGGRGGERAAPLAGELMTAWFDLYGRP